MDKDIAVFAGSSADLPTLTDGLAVLDEFGLDFHLFVASDARSPEYVSELLRQCEMDNIQIMIACGGPGISLAGALAAKVTLPVIAVASGPNGPATGEEPLSMFTNPGGIPVAVTGAGPAGARNAMLYAIQILALQRPDLRQKMGEYRTDMRGKIKKINETLSKQGWKKYLKKVDS